MKCVIKGTVVGKGVWVSKKDNKEFPWVDVYSEGECPRVFGYPVSSFGGLSEGEPVEWPVRVFVNQNGRLCVTYDDR